MARSFIYTNAFSWEELFSEPYTTVSSSDTSVILRKTINGVECSIAYVGSVLLGNSPVIDQILVTSRQSGADLARVVRYRDGDNDPDITRSIQALQSGGLSSFEHLMASEWGGVQIGSDQADIIRAFASADDVNGRAGNDTLISSTGDDMLSGDEGFDYASYETAGASVFVSMDDWPDRNTGEAYNDRFYGVEGLIGSAHDDHFIGDRFGNHLLGGDGNDTLSGSRFSSVDPDDDTLDGGSGIDTAQFLFNRADYEIVFAGGGYWRVTNRTAERDWTSLVTNIEFLKFADQTIAAPTGPGPIYGTPGADSLLGTSGADTIYGYSQDSTTDIGDILDGAGGNDTIYGGGGNDTIHGGTEDDHLYGDADSDHLYGDAGADTLIGGEGVDIYYVDSDDTVIESSDRDTDIVRALSSFTLQGGQRVEMLRADDETSDADLNLTGNEFSQSLLGNAGSNRLDGRGGADAMIGYGGDDTHVVDNVLDVVTEAADQGTDTVESRINYTLLEHFENLVLLDGATRGTGNAGANVITGNGSDNIIDGRGGNDRLIGKAGNDTYHVSDDVIEEIAGEGIDTIIVDSGVAAYTLGAGVHVEILKLDSEGSRGSLTGNELNNTLYGNKGRNTLDGGAGEDTVVFSGKRADYTIERNADGSFTVADARENGDRVDTITRVEIFKFTDITSTAGGLLLTEFRLTGDVVEENSPTGFEFGGFSIKGAFGAVHFELLNNAEGRFAIDQKTGEIRVEDGVRLDYEQARSHMIEVQATDATGASMKKTFTIQVGDSLNETATGSALGNVMVGGEGRDIFKGAGGNDRLSADGGNDRLYGEVGNDTLEGGSGNDLLDGGLNNDRVVGGLGKDTFTGGRGRDVFVFDDRETGSSKTKADYITDFKGREGDRLDLKVVDANTKKSGDQKFTFIGTKAFSKAGEVRYEKTKKETYVYLNTDSDKSAEAVIKLKGSMDLSKSWFVL